MNSIEKRQAVERRIVRRVIADLLRAGYLLNVDNGEEEIVPKSQTITAILAECFTVDMENLVVYKKDSPRAFGFVQFVYGNSGWDVICDYSINLEEYLKGANDLARREEQR